LNYNGCTPVIVEVRLAGPERLAIYYGWPSNVNAAAGNIAEAVASFSAFDVVVLGDGVEHPAHGDHTNAAQIITQLINAGVEVYGYIDMGVSTQNLSLATAQQYVDEWDALGVTGIFWDDVGFDYLVDRSRQVTLVSYTHAQGLTAFVNAWVPDDIFATVEGVPTPLAANDWYLAESHPVADGQLVDLAFWWNKSNQLATYRTATTVRIAAIASGNDGPLGWANADAYRQSLWAAYLFAWDSFGFTNIQYSSHGAGADRLRPLPHVATDVGTSYSGAPTMSGPGQFERATDLGVIKAWGAPGSGGGTFVGGACDTSSLGTAVWPTCSAAPPPQSSPFGPRQKASEAFRYDFHRGVDIPQAFGAPVYAPIDGVVRLAGVTPGFSDQVIQIRHRANAPYLFSDVLHMSSVVVAVDDLVTVGDLLGYSGEGESGFDHMHFEFRDGCTTQDCNRNPWGYLPYADIAPVTPSLVGANLSSSTSTVVVDVSTPDDQLDFDAVTLTWGSSFNLGLNAVNATTDPSFPEGKDHPVVALSSGVKACIFPGQFNLASDGATYRFAFTGLPVASAGAASGSDVDASSSAVALNPALPAVTIEPAVIQVGGVPGQVITLQHEVRNTSGAPVDLDVTARSAQNNPIVLSHAMLSLAAGAAQTVSVQVTLSASFPATVGDCILLEVDAGGQSVVAVGQVATSSCPSTPELGCNDAGSSALSLKYDALGKKRSLSWKWGRATTAVEAVDLGDALTAGAVYRVCLYDALASTPLLVFGADVPSGALCGGVPCWKAIRDGFKYKDRSGTHGGLTAMQLKAGVAGKAKLSLKGKGANLVLPQAAGMTYLQADPSVVLQMTATETGSCWQSTLTAPADVTRNLGLQFKGKHRAP